MSRRAYGLVSRHLGNASLAVMAASWASLGEAPVQRWRMRSVAGFLISKMVLVVTDLLLIRRGIVVVVADILASVRFSQRCSFGELINCSIQVD